MTKESPESFSAIVDSELKAFPTMEAKFLVLEEAWNAAISKSGKLEFNSIAHLQIVGMGQAIAPLLLDRLAAGKAQWMFALKCVAPEIAYELIGMATDWKLKPS